MRMNKIKEEGWVGHVARVANKRYACKLLVANLKDLENLVVGGRIILKYNFNSG
jgi:hypothetical protein